VRRVDENGRERIVMVRRMRRCQRLPEVTHPVIRRG
jgi:hypothetical protein